MATKVIVKYLSGLSPRLNQIAYKIEITRRIKIASQSFPPPNSRPAARNMASLPDTYRKLVVKTLSTNFLEATEIVTEKLEKPKPNELLIRNKYLGINATDINITAGKYFVKGETGFIPGIETVGEVVAIGSEVKNFKVGQSAAVMGIGCFTEYLCKNSDEVWSIPEIKPEYLALLICGKTATIGLDKAGHIKEGDKVLITAAAGGTGHIAVQHAIAKGCHVIGLSSTDEKCSFLKDIGCDRVINYKKEKLGNVLKREYPTGIDVIWETIGGEVFNELYHNLAVKGRIVIVGFITQYKDQTGSKVSGLEELPGKLLSNSASVNGFLLPHYANELANYHSHLLEAYKDKKIKLKLDNGELVHDGMFKGLESVARAVEYLHSGKSIGKVYVEI